MKGTLEENHQIRHLSPVKLFQPEKNLLDIKRHLILHQYGEFNQNR